MKHAETVTFGGSGLERAAHLRGDPPPGDVLPIWRGKVLLTAEDGLRAPIFLTADHPVFEDAVEPAIFLGLDEGVPRYARDISAWEPEDDLGTVGAFFDPSEQ
ncbi:MAG: NADH pyrophosphatase, partial [Silicimonas sp.]|nr:NADH pyrophosphatase [Silicimonas sp.]